MKDSKNSVFCNNLAFISSISLFIVGWLITLVSATSAQEASPLDQTSLMKLEAAEADSLSRSGAEKKMSPDLIAASRASSGVATAGVSPQLQGSTAVGDSRSINIRGKLGAPLADAITKAGGAVIATSPGGEVVNAQVPIQSLNDIANRDDVYSLTSAPRARLNKLDSPLQDKDGETAHQAAEARQKFKVDGSGVTVCAISDGVNHLIEAQSSGALGVVSVLPGQAGSGSGGEGTAMLEIIHGIAPGARLRFATGLTGDVTMAQNIVALADVGCNIIVDDVTYLNESPFQDGIIGKAVDSVSKRGVLFFSSASNSGNKKHETAGVWEGDFHDGGPVMVNGKEIGRYHQFELGQPGYSITDPVIANTKTSSNVDFFWNDPIGGSTNNYYLGVTDGKGKLISFVDVSTTGNNDPYESVPINAGQRVVIIKGTGAQPRHLYIDTNGMILKYATSGAIRGHNGSGADNAFSVGAVTVQHPTGVFTGEASATVADYSSDGPRHLYFDADGTPINANMTASGGKILQKPDFSAADGVTTDVPGFAPFFGTSAAAPHAAAVAALLLSYRPDATPSQVRSALAAGCIPIEGGAYNLNAGAGIVMPSKVLQFASSIPEVHVSAAVTNKVP